MKVDFLLKPHPTNTQKDVISWRYCLKAGQMPNFQVRPRLNLLCPKARRIGLVGDGPLWAAGHSYADSNDLGLLFPLLGSSDPSTSAEGSTSSSPPCLKKDDPHRHHPDNVRCHFFPVSRTFLEIVDVFTPVGLAPEAEPRGGAVGGLRDCIHAQRLQRRQSAGAPEDARERATRPTDGRLFTVVHENGERSARGQCLLFLCVFASCK